MPRRLSTGVAILLLLLACGPAATPLVGQNPEAPYERLLHALLDGRADGERVVGEVPDGFPIELLPDGAEVLGSSIARSGSVVAVALPLPRSAAEQALREALLDADWSYADVGSQRGFRSAERPAVPPPHARPPIFCRGEEMMVLRPKRAENGSIVLLEWNDRSTVWCDRGATVTSRMPILSVPESVKLVGGAGGIATDHVVATSVFAETVLTAPELVEVFEGQLTAAGWSLGARVDGDSHASRGLAMRDEAGVEWVGLLSATPIPGTQWHELRLLLTQPEELRPNAGSHDEAMRLGA